MTATMPRPGSVVRFRSGVSSRNVPTATGPWFVAGLADRGPLISTPIRSLQDFISIFGLRQTYSVLYDAIETYFREGGVQANVSRVVGPGAAVSSRNLLDASAGTSLVISAKGPGAYAQTITVAVQNPGAGGTASSFSLTITDPNYPNGALTEQSPDFTTNGSCSIHARPRSRSGDTNRANDKSGIHRYLDARCICGAYSNSRSAGFSDIYHSDDRYGGT
jgi:hypothetical protein